MLRPKFSCGQNVTVFIRSVESDKYRNMNVRPSDLTSQPRVAQYAGFNSAITLSEMLYPLCKYDCFEPY